MGPGAFVKRYLFYEIRDGEKFYLVSDYDTWTKDKKRAGLFTGQDWQTWGSDGLEREISRRCKACQSELTEANLIKQGDQICKACKEATSGGKAERWNARIESDFRIKAGRAAWEAKRQRSA